MMTLARRTFFAGVALCAAAGAAAQEAEPPSLEHYGAPLTAAELEDMFTDATLRGCYNDRVEVVNETTASNGRFYDNLRGGVDAGYWYIANNNICYYYEIPTNSGPGPHCFYVVPRESYFDFISSGDGRQVASTQCEDEPIA